MCLLIACSVYDVQSQIQDKESPEFIFYDTKMIRVEDNKEKIQMQAEQIEFYQNKDDFYLKNATFTVRDDDENVSAEGSSALIAAQRELDLYYFFDRVYINSTEHQAEIHTDNIRWDNKTEVLSTGKDDTITIAIKNDSTILNITGQGFEAQGFDMTYAFANRITGTLVDVDGKDEETVEGNHAVE